jgi:hypothetical protein
VGGRAKRRFEPRAEKDRQSGSLTNNDPAESPSITLPDQRKGEALPPDMLDVDERPTPPRLPRVTKTLPALPPAAPILPPAAQEPAAPALPPASATTETQAIADADLMAPPAEDLVAKFLSDVASMEPPPARERAETVPLPAFLPPPSTTPEAAARKKARAQPFLSRLQTSSGALTHSENSAKTRRRKRWITLIAIAATLVILAALAVPALSLLHHRAPVHRATPTPRATSSSQPTPTPINLTGLTLLLNDPAPGCSTQGQDFWSFPNVDQTCASDGLHLTNDQQVPVVAELLSINGAKLNPNSIVVAQVILANGQPGDQIGLVTRFSGQEGYFFSINASGGWQIISWVQQGSQARLIGSGSSPVIHRGLQASNTLEVISVGTTFALYINQTWMDSFQDSTHPSGQVGLVLKNPGAQAIFSNFALYKAPGT